MNSLTLSTKDEDDLKLFEVLGFNRLVDENNIEVIISIYSFLEKDYIKESVLRTSLTPTSIRNLIERYGGICLDEMEAYRCIQKEVALLLVQSACYGTTEIYLKHRKLGWNTYKGELVFNGTNIYTKDKVIPSLYCGSYNIQETGSLSNIVELFNNCLCDNIPMQAIMCMAAAATVLPFANISWDVVLYNPINHLVGNSTTGKTTAAVLFTSFGGRPSGIDSFFLSFLGTENSIVSIIGNNKGEPCAIDEFSTSMSKTDWSKFIYTLANGRGVSRCIAGGSKVQDIDEFATVFLTTGEMSILNVCNKNEGVRARLFEYHIDSWTSSSEDSDKIKTVCMKNYGILTPCIAQELLSYGDSWRLHFKYWLDKTKKKIHNEKLFLGIGDRVASYVALYMTSCEILSQIMDVTMNIAEVFEFFYLHIIFKNAEDANLGERAYETLVGYFSKHRHLYPEGMLMMPDGFFMEPEQEGFTYYSQRGHSVGNKKYYYYVVFMPDIAENVLLRRGFTDAKVAFKAIQKDKLLKAKDGARLYAEEKINGITTKVYAIWVEDLYASS